MNQDARLVQPLPSSSGASVPPADHALAHRRIFIGPMPYSVSKTEDQDNQATDFVSQHGLRIFLQQGGRIDEWTEAKAKEYKERLKQRILESAAWHAVTGSGKKGKKRGMMPTVEWRGDTFEIGKIAGVGINMLATHEEPIPRPQSIRRSSDRSTRSRSATTVYWDESARTSFVTARTTLTGVASPSGVASPGLEVSQNTQLSPIPSGSSDANGRDSEHNESTSSRTPLFNETATQSIAHQDSSRSGISRGVRSEGDLSKKARNGLKSILTGPGKDKGKGKAVRYADTARTGAPSGSQSPLPPDVVLRREPTEMEDSSAAAAAEASQHGSQLNIIDSENGPVIRRDRMLIRVSRCENESLRHPFTDQECRKTRGLDSREWGEFLVIWRDRRLELYEDYHSPCKERVLGHKHLAFVIPLSPPRTKLSLFSSIDMSFCLICPPTPTKSKANKGRRSIFHRSRGLNVFVLKPKSRSRALDWIWSLWIELGTALPDHIEVSCPLVHATVHLPIPDGGAGWRAVTRDFVIDECSEALEGSFAWQTVIQLPILNGRRLELCWRVDTKLDWVWLRDDVDGRKRDWEVLFGAAVNRLGIPTQLELHLASHYPNTITTRDGKHLEEPPSIEGYVHAYKRKTQTRVQHYLSTHDGYLLAVQVEKVATPPTPTDLDKFAKSEEEFREDEQVRLRTQIMNARWFWDMRDILVVRRAMHPSHQIRDLSVTTNEVMQPADPDADVLAQALEPHNGDAELRRTESDIGDEGGDASLAHSANKSRLKMHRSFEVVLKNGRILRFETHSTKVAVEWVTHLRALVQYWIKRYRQDTVNEMNIMENLVEERITTSKRNYKNGYRLPVSGTDVENTTLYLDEFWNWCVLNGCRQIVKSGQVYMKRKYREQYIHTHLILTSGYLIQFRVKNDFSLHNHQMGRINLIDAYVCSGYSAALALRPDEYDPNATPLAKYFPDGLEARDLTEDTVFLLWHRPHMEFGKSDRSDSNKTPIPQLSSKRKVFVFKARSKLERDAWCWALNCEVERIVRQTKDREYRIREQGTPEPI